MACLGEKRSVDFARYLTVFDVIKTNDDPSWHSKRIRRIDGYLAAQMTSKEVFSQSFVTISRAAALSYHCRRSTDTVSPVYGLAPDKFIEKAAVE